VRTCRDWLETWIQQEFGTRAEWRRDWSLWINHAWEFFWASGSSIPEAKATLQEAKRARHWTGINWTGESSTLSGIDSIAHPTMSRKVNPKQRNHRAENQAIRQFYRQLSQYAPESIIDPREQLSIPELVKRLVTIDDITNKLPQVQAPHSFKPLNRWKEEDTPTEPNRQEEQRWTGWFQGDGDQVGTYLNTHIKRLIHTRDITADSPEADRLYAEELNKFSYQMRTWGENLRSTLPHFEKQRTTLDRDGRIIYAGGDDFLGVLYRDPRDPELTATECFNWFSTFKQKVWSQHNQPITVSVGFVWASPQVPQRDVLQHCRAAEQSAKDNGRDRIAFRILFAGGNYLEWVCPWRFLHLLQDYRDRNGDQAPEKKPKWSHLYGDVATLEARHGFGNSNDVTLALFEAYFGQRHRGTITNQNNWWNQYDTHGLQIETGILGKQDQCHDPIKALNQWIINLAKVGFHLCR
jgi:CRISPR-associated protein Cmr2